ncbi:Predicted acetyltransferase [Modestobacter sp. DSM 44400]|uniref:GNAT family N-acetyltransferase n=1 Tax=Modestobacter sp. DSM 44400 TaxID=1550230 RepID=UPI00089CE953|nr:GNAT family N-acetyltransferase [Modestobacter sp. DSM 44400]SDY60107.1 Predicted acetyltransferase [Modestobacter sp. DSM 44400]
MTIRPLTADDLPAAWELGRLAFGGPAEAPLHALREIPGTFRLGAFDDAGRLVGKVTDLAHEQWWGGRRMAAADVSGVAVRPESRGGGLARTLLTELLARVRDRGAAVSALYPTVTAVYRSMGWEVAGALRAADLDIAALPRPRDTGSVSLRPGGPDDLPAVTDLYEEVARARDGLLTRRGGIFDEPTETPLPRDVDAVTLAEDGGRLVGALLFGRGRGYGADSRLEVHDLLAATPQAGRALVGVLAGWTTVARTVRVPLLAGDAVSVALPLERAGTHASQPWMHRPVDVVRAVADRGWPGHLRGRVAFALTDAAAPWNAGVWQLELADGAGELTRVTAEPELTLDVRGFAVLYCGVGTGRGLAQAGLAGGTADPAALDLLAGGPPAELLDYF